MKKTKLLGSITAFLFVIVSIGAQLAMAQTGVIGFEDACWLRAFAMRGDGTGRVVLPLPPPVGTVQWGKQVYDVTTSGPVTVLLTGLFAIQVNDIGGMLTPDPAGPVNLRFADTTGLPPNINNASANLSPTGDRVAFYTDGVVVIADLARDASEKIIGFTNANVVANLFAIGSPSDSNATGGYAYTGGLDFSPDGTTLVASIYADLWLLHLSADGHTLLSSQPLTRTVGTSEWEAAFSPDGSKIAYTSAVNRYFKSIAGYAAPTDATNIYTLDLSTLRITQVTTQKSTGGSGSRTSAAWSPDGLYLTFTAPGALAGRNSTCTAVNYDLFRIKADGTAPATSLTNTTGTGVEMRGKWGW